MKMQQGVFFDLGWTLCAPQSGDWNLTKLFRERVSTQVWDRLDRLEVKRAYHGALKYLSEHHHLSTVDEEVAQYTEFYRLLCAPFPALHMTEALARELAEDRAYNLIGNYKLLPDALETVQAVKHAGYKVGVISDTWPSVTAQLRMYGMEGLFDTLTYSFEVGAFKPDPRMYRDAVRKMGLAPEETWFIDDSTRNLDGAAALNIRCVQSVAEPGISPDGRFLAIKKPIQLLRLLGID